MIDTVSKVVALVVSAVGAITTIYKVFFQGDQGRRQSYYECLLKPFVIAYKQNSELDVITFVRSKAKQDNDSIPKYIFYLLSMHSKENDAVSSQEDSPKTQEESTSKKAENSGDVLKKVLLVDYLNMYPNETNKKQGIFEKINKILNYVVFLLVFIFIFTGSIYIVNGVFSLISSLSMDAVVTMEMNGIKMNLWQWNLLEILKGALIPFVGLLPVKLSESLDTDMYTINKKRIQKMIKKKVRRYNKHSDKYIV